MFRTLQPATRIRLFWCAVALAGLAGVHVMPGTTYATSSLGMRSIEELTDRSDLVVRGSVRSIQSFSENSGIFTDIELGVLETLKGSTGEAPTVLRLYGGVFEGKRVVVMGAPCFSTGEDVVVFLIARGAGTYDVVNLAEGKFAVAQRADGTLTVRRDLSDIAYLGTATPPAIPETLDDLRAAVLAASR